MYEILVNVEKYFRIEGGERVNVIDHTLEQINKWPNLKIYIGTDSQSYSDRTIYVTAIVYRYGNRGAHYVYHKESFPRERVDYTRLFNEGMRTIEAYELLQDHISVSVEAIEFDYADVKKTISSQLVSTFKNWGYANAVFKSGQMIATRAADHVCRNK